MQIWPERTLPPIPDIRHSGKVGPGHRRIITHHNGYVCDRITWGTRYLFISLYYAGSLSSLAFPRLWHPVEI